MDTVLWIGGILAVVAAGSAYMRKLRRDNLMAKYGDAAVVQKIMAREVWQGMTKDQLIDSWGRPADVGQKVYKTKTTETFKYNQTGQNRFASRVTVENGIVLGWQQR